MLDRHSCAVARCESLKDLPDLMVFNDEAHHIHEIKQAGEVTEVEWQKSLTEIASTKGDRFIQIDFSATPYNEVGQRQERRARQYFPHIVVDFDLNDAMSAGLVKALALDKRRRSPRCHWTSGRARRAQAASSALSNGQRVMLRAGLTKLQILEEQFAADRPDKHPKLLVVCEDTSVTPHVVEFLKQAGLGEDDVLARRLQPKGEMSKAEWEPTRERLFDVDRHTQPKVIVSVLMLREGFDVNNICVIVPLRSSQARSCWSRRSGAACGSCGAATSRSTS